MKKVTLILTLVLLIFNNGYSQHESVYPDIITCISGDCQNGYGSQVTCQESNENECYLYEGEFKYNGRKWGNGILHKGSLTTDPIIYKGEFKYGEPHGYGITYDNNGDILYEGFVERYIYGYNGSGTLYIKNKGRYNGQFVNGKIEGYGTLYDTNGSVICQGNWENGTFVNQNSSSNSSSALAGAIIAGAAIYEVGKLIFGGASSSSSSSSSSGSSTSTNDNNQTSCWQYKRTTTIHYQSNDYSAKVYLKLENLHEVTIFYYGDDNHKEGWYYFDDGVFITHIGYLGSTEEEALATETGCK